MGTDDDDNVIPFPGGRDLSVGEQHDELATQLIERLGGPEAAYAALSGLADSTGSAGVGQEPRLTPVLLPQRPVRVSYVVRIDLDRAQPPIWRRLRLASDLNLAQLHEVLQLAMGWTDSHLHHFIMGPAIKNWRMDPFLTLFDIDEGEEGILESDVRLDQVLTAKGDRLFYEYDFGDYWQHTLRLEKVEAWRDGDPEAFCLDGRRACPPEDVGGISGYDEMLAALSGTHPEEDEAAQILAWLPDGYDPATFSVDEVNALLAAGILPALNRWHPMLGELLHRVGGSGQSGVGLLIKRTCVDPGDLTDQEASQAVAPYVLLMRTVGDGVQLTTAGYLPPAIVQVLAGGLRGDLPLIRKVNRESNTLSVLRLRESATALGLLRKQRGRLTVTKAGQRLIDRPQALWQHIRGRLPIGRPYEQDAGLLALLYLATGADWYDVRREAAAVLARLGWQVSEGELWQAVYSMAHPTMDVFRTLTGRRLDLDWRVRVARGLLHRPVTGSA